jgi:hypothetical protein
MVIYGRALSFHPAHKKDLKDLLAYAESSSSILKSEEVIDKRHHENAVRGARGMGEAEPWI